MKLVLFLLFAAVTAFTYWLRQINLNHLRRHGGTVPDGFEGAIDEATLRKTTAYTFETSRLGLWSSLFDNLLLVAFLFGGIIVVYDRFVLGITPSFIVASVLFFLLMTWAESLLSIPFSLYGTFRIEARYGFNTMTPLLWVKDFIKSQAISAIILTLLLSAAFWLIGWSREHWWIWVWLLMALFSLFMMYLSPYVIEPLFNRFEPISEDGLVDEIRLMMEKAGLKVSSVMQMDASRRSKHSNAYFTGIGKVKRIVLYDTLLKQMSHEEIVAVLAHEIGHWKKGHIWKRLVTAEIMALAGSWVAFRALEWPGLPQLLGLPIDISLAAKMVILSFVGSLVLFPFGPLSAWISRRHEREADAFAAEVSDPAALASALVKMSAENLSNIHPHPFYAWFYYSHPPVVERVATLRAAARQQAAP